MAYSKAKLKRSGDKASPVLDHSGQGNYQTNVYLYVSFKYVLISLTNFMSAPELEARQLKLSHIF
jgi:hypothetical protein